MKHKKPAARCSLTTGFSYWFLKIIDMLSAQRHNDPVLQKSRWMPTMLSTTSKTMTMICITLTAAILMLLAVPVLTGWSEGYLAIRSMYDVQISSRYNNVYEENDLPGGNYDTITSFMTCLLYTSPSPRD